MRIIGNPAQGRRPLVSQTDVAAELRGQRGLTGNISERIAQLSAANAAFGNAPHSATQILSATNRDLIQPLNAAQLIASVLGKELGGDAELLRLIGNLNSTIGPSDRLIRAFLDITKIDGSGIRPNSEPLKLNEIFDEIVREFAGQAGAKGIRLRSVTTGVWVESDRALLTGVLSNLIDNALRYTEQGGVLMGVRREGEYARLSIFDTGPGVADDDTERLLSELHRGYIAQGRDGAGLSLAIVRRLSALFGLIIETRSQLGRGSEFSLTMPMLRLDKDNRDHEPRPRPELNAVRALAGEKGRMPHSPIAALLKQWGLDRAIAQIGDSQLLRLISNLDGSTAATERLIRALLDVSSFNSGAVRPRNEPIKLQEIFDEIMREFARQPATNAIGLRGLAPSIWVESDRSLLTSILRNILSDALRYSDNRSAQVGVQREGETAQIRVLDTGPRIAEDDIERLLSEFMRGPSLQDRGAQALGLAIATRVSALFGLVIESRYDLGRWNEIILTMPVPQRIEQERNNPSPQGAKFIGARILVVDYDPSELSATKALLQKWEMKVLLAQSGKEALTLCPKAPDMVIMNYRLSGDERGDSAFEMLCNAWGERPPSILLTSVTDDEIERAAYRMGANCLRKPPAPTALRALISQGLSGRQATI